MQQTSLRQRTRQVFGNAIHCRAWLLVALNLACAPGCCSTRGARLEFVGPHCSHPPIDPLSPRSVTFTPYLPYAGAVFVEVRETQLSYEDYPWDARYGNQHARSLKSRALTTLRVIEADEWRAGATCEVEQSYLDSLNRAGRVVQKTWFDIEAQTEDHWGDLVDIHVTSRSPDSVSPFFMTNRCANQLRSTGLFSRQGHGERVIRLGEEREANYQTHRWLSLQSMITPLLSNTPTYISVQLHSVRAGLAEFSVCAHEHRNEVDRQPYNFVASGRWVVAVDGLYTVRFDLQGKYYAPTLERPVGEYHTWSRLILPSALSAKTSRHGGAATAESPI